MNPQDLKPNVIVRGPMFPEPVKVIRLKRDYWLYVVFNCGSVPEIRIVQDPARLNWEPLVKIEHYYTKASTILEAGSC